MPEHYTTRRRLTDILAGGTDEIKRQWDTTEAAGDFAPLPSGQYACHVRDVSLFNARSGTPGAKITFRVCDGEHTGRHVFHDLWLTSAALPQTKRDLGKLGIQQLEQLDNGAIARDRIRCTVRVVLRRDDDGEHYNRVRRFDVIRIDEPERDPFAPAEGSETESDTPADGTAEDASFAFGANAEAAARNDTPAEGGGE